MFATECLPLSSLLPRLPAIRRRALLALPAVAAAASIAPAGAQSSKWDAPNVVIISPRLVTSGQPGAAALAALASQGFGAVIYLAPPTVPDAVRDEAGIVQRQGLGYVNIPTRFDASPNALQATQSSLREICGLATTPCSSSRSTASTSTAWTCSAWNDAGRITDFKVMLRPLKAVQLIRQKMAAMMQANP